MTTLNNLSKGMIIKSISGTFDVLDESGKRITLKIRGKVRRLNIIPVVGDMVMYTNTGAKTGIIEEILPRANHLRRPPISNVDFALIVISTKIPKFSLNMIDRILMEIYDENIQPILIITKLDLLSENEIVEVKDALNYYRDSLNIAVFYKNEVSSQKLKSELQQIIGGKLAILTGESGAGKSTFLNYIFSGLKLKTDEVSKALNHGKNTTRHTELYMDDDFLLVDTPGFSSINIDKFVPEEIRDLFPDFVKAGQECKFRNCFHLNEPKCNVKRLVEQDNIPKSRYDDYVSFVIESRAKIRY